MFNNLIQYLTTTTHTGFDYVLFMLGCQPWNEISKVLCFEISFHG